LLQRALKKLDRRLVVVLFEHVLGLGQQVGRGELGLGHSSCVAWTRDCTQGQID
jgi:hypothetical protein